MLRQTPIKFGLMAGLVLGLFEGIQAAALDDYPWTPQQIVLRCMLFGVLFGTVMGLYLWRLKGADSKRSRKPTVAPTDPELLRNFTPRAQQAISMARKEADRFRHNFVGTEHILLGLIKLGQGVAVNVLQRLGVDLETVRMEVEKYVGPGPDQKMVGNIPYTPRVKKVLALATKEAKALHHTYVGTEHILLGLLREGDGIAGRVLSALGVGIERTRREVLVELDPDFRDPNANNDKDSES